MVGPWKSRGISPRTQSCSYDMAVVVGSNGGSFRELKTGLVDLETGMRVLINESHCMSLKLKFVRMGTLVVTASLPKVEGVRVGCFVWLKEREQVANDVVAARCECDGANGPV